MVKNETLTNSCDFLSDNTDSPVCDTTTCEAYATLCSEETWPHYNFILRSSLTIAGLILSLPLSKVLQYFISYDNIDNFVTRILNFVTCQKIPNNSNTIEERGGGGTETVDTNA